MDSAGGATPYRVAGCPIRRSSDHCVVARSPMLIAAAHVLHRHSTPRHPPHAYGPSSSVPRHQESVSRPGPHQIDPLTPTELSISIDHPHSVRGSSTPDN